MAPSRPVRACAGGADHQLHPVGAAGLQRAQEIRPEGLGRGWPDLKADDLAAAFGIGGNSDHGRAADDPPAPAHLQTGGAAPDARPCAGARAVRGKRASPLLDVLAQPGHGALRDAAQAHGLYHIIAAAERHAADPGFLHDRDQRLFRGLAGLRESRERSCPAAALAPAGSMCPRRGARARSRWPLRQDVRSPVRA